MTPFIARRRVEFADTDQAGMMHFSNFFRFMEFAEQEYLRSRGLSVTWQEAGENYGFPRVSAKCDFAHPARFEQTLEIQVEVESIGSKSVTYRFEFHYEGAVLARGAMTSVCCRAVPGGAIESVHIPPEFRGRLTANE